MLRLSFNLMLVLSFLLSACHGPDREPGRPIEVLIDEAGVSHIYGATDEDAFFGAGYQMASDRLFQMETLRRFSLGRLSEVIGEPGLERDRQARTFDLPLWGRADAELTRAVDPERAGLIAAWVKGINRRIEEVRSGEAPLPFGYGPKEYDFLPEPWDGADPYIVLKGAGFALDKTIEFEVAMSIISVLYPRAFNSVQVFKPAHPVFGLPPEDRPTSCEIPPDGLHSSDAKQPGEWTASKDGKLRGLGTLARGLVAPPRPAGSNNWAVDGRFTGTGRPLIAGDPHLSFDFFGAPYPMHINSADAGGTFDVIGFAYPGTPGIALGHNDRVMWTATSAFGDVNDIWKVRRCDDGIFVGEGIFVGDECMPTTERTERVVVRDPGGPAGRGRVETMVYEEVEGFGVIIPQEVIEIPLVGPYLMNWTGFEARPARWFMELNRVSSLDAFEEAVDRMREMNNAFVAADATGIAYRVGVEVPLRRDTGGGRAPWKAMDARDGGSLWTGEMLPRSRMPGSRAPEQGWLATANNDPFGFTGDGRIDNDPWFYGAFFAPAYRAKRIEDELARLTRRGGVTLEEMKALQMDLHSTLADDLLPLLAEAHGRIGDDERLEKFGGRSDLDRLVRLLTMEWDRRMARDSAGALAFHAFLHFLTAQTIGDDISLAYDFAVNLQAVFVIKVAAMAIGGAYPEGEMILQGGRDFILLTATSRTADWLIRSFGGVDPSGYAFADRKATCFDDAFGYGMAVFTKPTDGGEDTLNVSQNILFSETADEWVTTYVSVERSVGTFAEDGTPMAFVNFPVGARADPHSPETRSANEEYIEGRYRKLLFRRDEIEAATVERYELTY